MAQLPSDTIYRDLKQKGLDLSPCTKVQVPDPQPMKVSVLKKLSTAVSRKKEQSTQSPMKVIQILYNCFLAIKKHCIFVYGYTYNQQSKSIQITNTSTYNLAYQIQQIYTCLSKYIQDRDFPIIVKNSAGVTYFNFDLKEYKLHEKNVIKLQSVLGIGWVSDRECFIVDGELIKHYHINQGLLTCKSTQPVNLCIDKEQKLKKMWILGKIDEHQDSTISIIYITVPKEEVSNKKIIMTLKIKEFIRTLDGDLTVSPKQDYFLQTKSLQYKQNFNVVAVGEYFCLQLANQILIMKKKYEKYMLLDNMVEMMHGYEVKLNRKGLIVSIGQNLLQLNCIHFADPKCSSRICDVIEFPQELKGYHKNFKEIWPIISNKQYTLIFVFVKDNEIILSGLIKMQPMIKMMSLAKKNPKNKLEVIQQMALNLGIKRKDFYLKLWTTSKKQNSDIYQYLIPCRDVTSIKKQLKFTLRQRTIQVSQILKILEKISDQNLTNLKADLTQKNLTQYLKTDFLRKKIILNSMDKMLDHRIFDRIYSSSLLDIFEQIVREELDPIQPKFDPLNSSMNYQPIKQMKTLEMVFKQFKVILLQDYKNFLISFLQRFPNKILEVLNRFNFLLPNHPFEIEVQKPSKTNQPIILQIKPNATPQQLWFQTVTVSEWEAEVTKQKILKSLFNDFQTSKILESVDQFNNSLYGRQNKRWKHGLIILSLDSYIEKLKNINGIQLYLDVCQFANQISVARNGDPKISQKIIDKLKQKNNLTDPHAHYCKLYATMHYFMLKNKIIPKNKLEISALTKLKPQSLVAIFFLENKQRKQHIFGDFKNLYEDKNQFKDVLERFVESQNCSRIELQILMKQILARGQYFQQENQDIIDIMITGVCMKVQIRETLVILDKDEEQDNCIIDHIQLSKDLALKVNRVKRLKLCKNIFKCFGLQKKTYKQLLDLEIDNSIFSLLLQKYFEIREDQQRIDQFEVAIEDQQKINLENPRNLLTILVYLQENVYYSAKTFDILILFGLELILWKQFGVMRDLVNDQNALETLGVDRSQYIQTLTLRGLQTIYLDPQIIYEEQTKQQIINILNIDDEISNLKIRENAKLDLVSIFTDWGLQVHPSDIHTICYEWKEQNREEFINDLIDKYIDKLDFRTFQEIFRLLEITEKENIDVNIYTVQYLVFCGYYAKKLLQEHRYKEVIEVIIFLMKYEEAGKVEYDMLVQSYIKTVIEMFGDNQEKCKKYIQFFVQKYDTEEYSVRQLLQSQFDENVILLWNRNPQILIDHKYLWEKAKKFDCYVALDDLWHMANAQASNTQEIYYNYFFLMMGLTNPPKGFGETVGISYNPQKLNNLILGDLDNLLQKNENLVFVNYYQLQKYFLFNGMLGQAVHNLQLQVPEVERRLKFQVILKELRNRRTQNQKNDIILNILTKLKPQVSNRTKINARKDRYLKKLEEISKKQNEKNKNKQLELNLEEPEEKVEELPEKFLNWQTIQQEKQKSRFSLSQIIMSEKDLIDQVYENIDTSKLKQKEATKPLKPSIFSNLFIPVLKGLEKTAKIIQLIQNGKYEQLGNYSQNSVKQAIQKVFQNPEKNYYQISDILRQVNIGDQFKHQVFSQAKDYLKNLPHSVGKILFPIQFFTTPIQQEDESYKYALIYEELKPKFQKVIPILNNKQLTSLANLIGVCLHSSKYADEIYYQALMYTGKNCYFDANSALVAQECVRGLAQNREIITKNYKQILDNMTYDKEMRPYVKQLLIKVAQKRYKQFREHIKRVPSIIN